ncbi:hypothetical protein Misp01_50840 [Microtetraspora sp. NBRC 13810]|nr:hypothetical protein Misp01_50840 [Microtetraspora sp. NBRC 13810]
MSSPREAKIGRRHRGSSARFPFLVLSGSDTRGIAAGRVHTPARRTVNRVRNPVFPAWIKAVTSDDT